MQHVQHTTGMKVKLPLQFRATRAQDLQVVKFNIVLYQHPARSFDNVHIIFMSTENERYHISVFGFALNTPLSLVF